MSDDASASAVVAERKNVMKVEITWEGKICSEVEIPYDLKDKSVVEEYWGKYNTLFVKLVGKEEPEEFDMDMFELDYKSPKSFLLWRLREDEKGNAHESETDAEVVEDVASLSIAKD